MGRGLRGMQHRAITDGAASGPASVAALRALNAAPGIGDMMVRLEHWQDTLEVSELHSPLLACAFF